MPKRPYIPPRPRVDWFLAAAAGLVALLIILLALLPGLVVSSELRTDTKETQRLSPMVASASNILSLMVDQEASERGYIITANQSFLAPFTTGRQQLEALWPIAEKQANDLGGQTPSLLAAVHRSATAWQLEAADAEIGDVRAGYQLDAASAVASGRSEALFDQFRADSAALSGYLQELQRAQVAARDRDLGRLRVIESILVGVGLLALGLLGYAGARYVSLLRRVVLADSEARFRNIVETANEGVWLIDAQAHTLLANERMTQLLGVAPEGLEDGFLYDFCFSEDVKSVEERIRNNLLGQSDQFDFRFRRADGTPVLVLACTSPMREASGRVMGVLGMYSDITERKRAEEERNELLVRVQEGHEATEVARRRLALLVEVSRRLAAAGVDLQAVLDTAAKQTAEVLGDACILRLASEDGRSLRTASVYALDPGLLLALRQETGESFDLDDGGAAVYRADRPLRLSAADPANLRPALGRADRCLLDRFAIHSLLVVPIHAGGRTLGTLTVWRTASGRPHTQDDQELLQELADRIGLAIENARLYRDAVQALQSRDEFLSAVSHDLRSPLTAVRGFTQLMLRRVLSRETQEAKQMAAALSSIDRATERMSLMIGDLLDLTQLQDGRPLSLNRQQVDLVALARQLADEQQQATGQHQITVEAATPSLPGFWDPVRIARALTNLLSNAVKYSPRGGPITVSVARTRGPGGGGDWAELSVRDVGVGISPEDLPRIFDRFHRGANVSGITGLGIGLTAVKQIVEQHGGILDVTSEPGKGSVFTIRLPVMVPEAAEV